MLSCCRWQEEPPSELVSPLEPEAELRISTLHVGWQPCWDGDADCVFREVKDLEHYNFEIEVWKMKEDFFGLDFDSSNPMVPVIAQVPSEGQAAKWNQRSEPLRRLRPGLGLRSVNEMESNDSKYLLDLLQQSTGHLTLGFTRPSMETLTLQRRSVDSWGIRAVPTAKAGSLYVEYTEGIADEGGLQGGMHICDVNGMVDAEKQMKEIKEATMLTLRVASFVEPELRVASYV